MRFEATSRLPFANKKVSSMLSSLLQTDAFNVLFIWWKWESKYIAFGARPHRFYRMSLIHLPLNLVN